MEAKNKNISNYISKNSIQIEEIMKEYTNYIYTIIRNARNNLTKEDMEEIALDVYLTIWNNQKKLDISKSMSSYIGGITKNLIKKKNRKNKINDNIEDYEEQLVDLSNIEINITESEKTTIIMNEIEKMRKEEKEIFIQYYYEEKNIKEISRKLKVTESKIKSKLFRIRKKLKKELKERGYNSNER